MEEWIIFGFAHHSESWFEKKIVGACVLITSVDELRSNASILCKNLMAKRHWHVDLHLFVIKNFKLSNNVGV
jgi:hypothetical protein